MGPGMVTNRGAASYRLPPDALIRLHRATIRLTTLLPVVDGADQPRTLAQRHRALTLKVSVVHLIFSQQAGVGAFYFPTYVESGHSVLLLLFSSQLSGH